MWEVVDEGGIRSWNLGRVDGICGAIFDEESEQGVD